MNILVLDVAASESGALTVLNEYYKACGKDAENRYFFCVGRPELESAGNIEVLRFPWVKRSWLHRIWFDRFFVPKLIRKCQADRVFSLQNMIPGNPECEKWVYLHQSIPFVEARFSLWKAPKLWVIQTVMGRMICASLRKADRVIVQTKWMREAAAKKSGASRDKFVVEPPKLDESEIVRCTNRETARGRLFYPATPFVYKNHRILLEALRLLKERGELGDIRLTLTIDGMENKLSSELLRYAKEHGLPVDFVGRLPREEVLRRYAESTLIFPSYVETVGLPLLEARRAGAPILASDCAFSREILDGYDSAAFFDSFDAEACAREIERLDRA